MASPPPPQQPASSFFPQNHELLLLYLHPKLSGSPLPPATEHFFHEADVYAAEPSTLTSLYSAAPARVFGESENWYFFCPVKPKIARDGRKPRVVAGDKGTWKAEKGDPVLHPVAGNCIGRLERFSYTPKPKQEGKREWLMVEFSLNQELVGGGEPATVLCKIYRSPRFLNSASKSSSSSSASARRWKRKASDERPTPASKNIKAADERRASASKNIKAADESAPVRRQLLFPPPPAPITQAQVLEMDDEAFGDDQFWSECRRIGDLSDPAPNPPVQVDDLGDKFWGELPVLEDSAPWSCSTVMAAASTPFCGGTDFWNSIATL